MKRYFGDKLPPYIRYPTRLFGFYLFLLGGLGVFFLSKMFLSFEVKSWENFSGIIVPFAVSVFCTLVGLSIWLRRDSANP